MVEIRSHQSVGALKFVDHHVDRSSDFSKETGIEERALCTSSRKIKLCKFVAMMYHTL
jgi:hypothetical protein